MSVNITRLQNSIISQKKISYLLDFSLTKKISANFVKLKEGFDLTPDHSLIILVVSGKAIRAESSQ